MKHIRELVPDWAWAVMVTGFFANTASIIIRAWAVPVIAAAFILAEPAKADYSALERDAIIRDAAAGSGTGGYSASTGNMSYAYGGTLWRWFKALIWY